MYSKTRKRFKAFRVLHFLILLFYSHSAFSYSLSSDELVNKTDFFTKYKPSSEDVVVQTFIKECFYDSKKDCMKRLLVLSKNSEYSEFLDLFKATFFKRFSGQEEGLLFLDEVKDKLNQEDLENFILKTNIKRDSKDWYVRNFNSLKKSLSSLVQEEPNTLCSLHRLSSVDEASAKGASSKAEKTYDKNQVKFIKDQLLILSRRSDRFELNFSRHPCGVDTFKYLKNLKKDKENFDKGLYSFDYKYNFYQKKASLKIYKTIKRKKDLDFWKQLVKENKSVQDLIVKNTFFKKNFSRVSAVTETQILKLRPQALMYVAKAFLYGNEHDRLESLSQKLNYEKAIWAEEILLTLSISRIRQKKWTEAKRSLEKLLKYHVDLRLSGLYWLWVINDKINLKAENKKIIELVEKHYAFTYYGLRILIKEKGSKYLKNFVKPKNLKVKKFKLSKKKIKKFLIYYSGGFDDLYTKHLEKTKKNMDVKELALFTMILERFGKRLEAIKFLKFVWEQDSKLRIRPLFQVSYPFLYEPLVDSAVKRLKYVTKPLVWSISRQESAFNPRAQSASGAKGLMQVIGSTGREVSRQMRLKNYKGSRSLFKPEINLQIGAKYLDRLIVSSKGYVPYALASYNAGPGNMFRWSKLRPGVQDLRKGFDVKSYEAFDEIWVEELPWSETRFYVKAVLRNFGLYRLLSDQSSGFSCDFYWICT